MLGLVALRPIDRRIDSAAWTGRAEPVPAEQHGTPRLWLVFFSDTESPYWWSRLLRPGFQHVRAAAWYEATQRWVLFDPCGRGLNIEVATDEEFGPRFQYLIDRSSTILRVRSEFARTGMPASFWCVGAVKALLGVRSRALGPFGLYRHLLARGAEQVVRPREVAVGQHLLTTEAAASTAGRSRAEADARGGACPGGSGPHQVAPGPASPRNAAA